MASKIDRLGLKELQEVVKAADSLTSALSALKKKVEFIEVLNYQIIRTHSADIQNFMNCVEGTVATLVPNSLAIIADHRTNSGKAAAAHASNGE